MAGRQLRINIRIKNKLFIISNDWRKSGLAVSFVDICQWSFQAETWISWWFRLPLLMKINLLLNFFIGIIINLFAEIDVMFWNILRLSWNHQLLNFIPSLLHFNISLNHFHPAPSFPHFQIILCNNSFFAIVVDAPGHAFCPKYHALLISISIMQQLFKFGFRRGVDYTHFHSTWTQN